MLVVIKYMYKKHVTISDTVNKQKQQPEVFYDKNFEACNLIKKEYATRVPSCEFCENFSNIFFKEHLRTTTSGETLSLSINSNPS